MRSSCVVLAGSLLAFAGLAHAAEPLAHWTMDALVEGVVPDATGNGHDARLGPEGVEPPTVVLGVVGSALEFVGEKQHFLSVSPAQDLNVTEPFTVMAWVRPARRNAAFEIACLKEDRSGDPPWPGWRLRYFWARAMLQVGTPDGHEPSVSSPEWSVPPGFWSHIAATWDGAKLRVFVNAVEEGATDFAGAIAPQSPRLPLVIGNYLGRKNAYAFEGLLDDVKVFRGALTEDAVLMEAAQGLS